MKIFTSLFLVTLCIFATKEVQAADGDTTTIQAHQEVHWKSNGNYFDTLNFPSTGTYQKVIMHYILGCPSTGCSEWDYTTRIQVWDPNNDTERFELAKVITPYAGDKNQGWYHEYKFDVTHMLPVLQGERVMNARYDGWSNGFTISVFFEFIEGTPPRTALQVDQVYMGSYKYGNSGNPINGLLQKDTIVKNVNTSEVEFIMSATGHGFGNNNGQGTNIENCAEFCDKYYDLRVNNTKRYQQTVWKNDCGSEPLYAQTGTWIYNRAGWCPGSGSQVFKHDISAFATTTDFTVEVDWEDYTLNNVPTSAYNVSGQVIQYGPANHVLDAEIMDVLNPSTYDRYSRYNPTAQAPTIILRNTGSALIGAVKIKYGVSGGTFYTTTWMGSLAFMESEEVTLPIPEHNFYKGDGSNVFIAEILEVNHAIDEVASNNKYKSDFESIPFRNGPFVLEVTSNNYGSENWYILTNAQGDTVLYKSNLGNNTTYVDTLDLPDDAYTFYIEDAGGDGLSWWANSAQGTGSVTLKNIGVTDSQSPNYVDRLEADFGNFFIYDFSIGYDITIGKPDYDETTWSPPVSVGIVEAQKEQTVGSFDVYPNPSSDFVNIQSNMYDGKTMIKVYNQLGALIFQSHLGLQVGSVESIQTKDWATGIYFISLNDEVKRETIKFIKN